MIIRFVAKNIFSFKEETEFNLLPNKNRSLPHHKIQVGGFDFLRFSAIYGANGAGKSNLIKAIDLLESMVEQGKIVPDVNDLKFKLDDAYSTLPVSLAIEFYFNSKIYYYTITFDEDVILHEYLAESKKKNDILIFERTVENGTQKIQFFDGYDKDEKNKLFVEVLAEKLLSQNELLLTFLSKKYLDEFKDVRNVYDWFETMLVIIRPEAKPSGIAHKLDVNVKIKEFANKFILSLNTGISQIGVVKGQITNSKLKEEVMEIFKKYPDTPYVHIPVNERTGEDVTCCVLENGDIIAKRLVTNHTNSEGNNVPFTLGQESDGTKRLIDYIPALEEVIDTNRVYLIDEIERSIHPITIKEIVKKLSLDESVNGQLIFTTHESNLLDQEILRPDEIWFAQKDIDGASKLYSLSDFKIHNTIDIENGYLNGRYGGIPFLSNLKDLNWK